VHDVGGEIMPTAEQYWKDRDKCRQRNREWYQARKCDKTAPHKRAVMILDPKCADPDWVSKAEYERNRNEWHKDGRRVFINGVEAVL
jgi:hypothetical protein